MKKLMICAVAIAGLAWAALALTGCSNPLSSDATGEGEIPDGKGRAVLQLQEDIDTLRTVFPDPPLLARVDLVFTADSDGAVVEDSVQPERMHQQYTLDLAPGDWTLKASAFADFEGSTVEVASTAMDLAIVEGEATSLQVVMQSYMGDADSRGRLGWHVEIPSELEVQSYAYTVEQIGADSPVAEGAGDIPAGEFFQIQGSEIVATGYYRVVLDLYTSHTSARIRRVVHVHDQLKSHVYYWVADEDFAPFSRILLPLNITADGVPQTSVEDYHPMVSFMREGQRVPYGSLWELSGTTRDSTTAGLTYPVELDIEVMHRTSDDPEAGYLLPQSAVLSMPEPGEYELDIVADYATLTLSGSLDVQNDPDFGSDPTGLQVVASSSRTDYLGSARAVTPVQADGSWSMTAAVPPEATELYFLITDQDYSTEKPAYVSQTVSNSDVEGIALQLGDAAPDVTVIDLWTNDGTQYGGLDYVQGLADAFMDQNAGVWMNVYNKGTHDLREDFIAASIDGSAPQLLWTVSDDVGPFVTAELLQPVGDLYTRENYIPGIEMAGHVWAAPVYSGNHLMLMYNKQYVPEAPATMNELITTAQQVMNDNEGVYGLLWNMQEAFWMVPWLGAFEGSVFADDGVTPTLDTPAMVQALDLMRSLKFDHGITPSETATDYATMEELFTQGSAAMIINGDWALNHYLDMLGDDLGVAPIPMVDSTGLWPAPFTSGKYLMASNQTTAEQDQVIAAFIDFALNEDNQRALMTQLHRLPALLSLENDPFITNDPLQQGSLAQMQRGVPMPSVWQMRQVWDAIGPEQFRVMVGDATPEEAAANMQTLAETGIGDNQ